MDRKKKIYIGLGIVAVGLFLLIVKPFKKKKPAGNTPPPNADGTTNPSDGGQPQSAESQLEQGNPNQIQIGDFITPYNEFTRVRTSTEIDDGLWDNWKKADLMNLYFKLEEEGKTDKDLFDNLMANTTKLAKENFGKSHDDITAVLIIF